VVIENDKPRFVGVNELLKISTQNTLRLLELELKIKQGELQEHWHFASLERIFIEKKVYRKIEEAETWEQVIEFIDKGLKPHVKHLRRAVTEEDIVRLTEIKIKRISKFDSFKADEHIKGLEDQLAEVQAQAGCAGGPRGGLLQGAEAQVRCGPRAQDRAAHLRHHRGHQGGGGQPQALRGPAKKASWAGACANFEFVDECSDIDDIIVFRVNGTMMVTKVADKKFIGKGILHVGRVEERRRAHHLPPGVPGRYQGRSYMKRFAVTGITRDKEYDLTNGAAGSKVWYFTANPDGAAEVVRCNLRPRPNLRKAQFDVDFGSWP
jgi:topoisomerase-4 subunit A